MKTYEWKSLPDGFVLVETIQYDQADQMPKSEETILGGCTKVDDYYYSYLKSKLVEMHLTTRFDVEKAKDDLIVRLTAMGHKITFENIAKA